MMKTAMSEAKKKLAFITTSFVVGGVEKSFLDLLQSIDQERYEVTVFLPDSKGEWTDLLLKKYRVRFLGHDRLKKQLVSQIKNGQFFDALRSLLYRALARIIRKTNYRKSTEYLSRSMPRVKEQFDCAIAYQIINDDCVLDTLFRIKASKKVVWSHAYIHKTEAIYGRWYNKFDKLFCVSEFARSRLVQNFPALTYKTEVLYNTVNIEKIRNLSLETPIPHEQKSYQLVTVGRLSPEKGQLLIAKAARLLLDAGCLIHWLIIGDGPMGNEVEESIQHEQVGDYVVMIGNQDNPYPYIRACDIYVQTSAPYPGEGWGLTISEAKALLKPIVTTASGAICEQIQNGVNGLIADEFTAECLADRIQYLIQHPELGRAFCKEQEKEMIFRPDEIKKLYAVIDQ